MHRNQKKQRSDLYHGLQDAITRSDKDGSSVGHIFILPCFFTRGLRYMVQQYRDAMAICRWARLPVMNTIP